MTAFRVKSESRNSYLQDRSFVFAYYMTIDRGWNTEEIDYFLFTRAEKVHIIKYRNYLKFNLLLFESSGDLGDNQRSRRTGALVPSSGAF